MLMKSSVSLVFLFQAAVCVGPTGLLERLYLSNAKTMWDEAKSLCEQNSSVLASIRNPVEILKLSAFPEVWIGLKRDPDDLNVWKWVEGDTATGIRWDSQEPDNNPLQNCVSVQTNGWHNRKCDHTLYFVCKESSVILVKESKTWEEALEHCRVLGTELFSVVTQYSPPNQLYPNSYRPSYSDYPDHQPIYDLPSVLSESQTYVQDLIQDALTDEVWTGLRFLEGKWLWMNGDTLGTGYQDLPECLGQEKHCGTLPKNRAQLWAIQDCGQKRNFIGHKKV